MLNILATVIQITQYIFMMFVVKINSIASFANALRLK